MYDHKRLHLHFLRSHHWLLGQHHSTLSTKGKYLTVCSSSCISSLYYLSIANSCSNVALTKYTHSTWRVFLLKCSLVCKVHWAFSSHSVTGEFLCCLRSQRYCFPNGLYPWPDSFCFPFGSMMCPQRAEPWRRSRSAWCRTSQRRCRGQGWHSCWWRPKPRSLHDWL